MSPSPYTYKCSHCGEKVNADDVAAHIEQHRTEEDWPGTCSLTLVSEDEACES